MVIPLLVLLLREEQLLIQFYFIVHSIQTSFEIETSPWLRPSNPVLTNKRITSAFGELKIKSSH